ncbi:hypothetical protein [Sphingobacterium sp.]|uniref:hypothetical protein n=1 Tax=Sphingobacterium sp. TaxID=341027 RepID=UPI0028B009BA|nr:hypothetical protein [Sphingobacterium sp.]
MSILPNSNNTLATQFLRKMGILDQLFKAIAPYRPENVAVEVKNTERFLDYEQRYADLEIEKRLISLLKQFYSESDLQKFSEMDADSIYEADKSRFKSFEKQIESLYDEIYIAGNRLCSGVTIVGTPDQSRPFEFFTVERENGLYVAKAFDSFMPQNIQLSQAALVDPIHFVSIMAKDQEIRIEISAEGQELISKHFQNNPYEPLALLLNQRIINIVRDTANLQNDVLLIRSPWPASALLEYTKSVKN